MTLRARIQTAARRGATAPAPLLAVLGYSMMLLLLGHPVCGASEGRPDYATAPYTIRELPFSGLADFSPDTSRMVFVEGGALKIFDIGSWGDIGTIMPPETQATMPTWTNNGRIFFHSQFEDPIQQQWPTQLMPLWVVDEDGGGLQRVDYPPGLPDSGPGRNWVPGVGISPDGATAVTWSRLEIGSWDMWRMDVTYEDDVVRLANPRKAISSPHFNELKEFTTDGKKVVFASTRGSGSGDRSVNADLFTYDLATEKIVRHTFAYTWEEQGDLLSGDGGPGDALAFNSDRSHPAPYQIWYQLPVPNDVDWAMIAMALIPLNTGTTHELFVAGPQGDHAWVRQLTFYYDHAEGFVPGRPKWSPDGRRILFRRIPNQAGGHLTLNPGDPSGVTARPEVRMMLVTFVAD